MTFAEGDRVLIGQNVVFKSATMAEGDRVRIGNYVTRSCPSLAVGDRVTTDPIGIRKSACESVIGTCNQITYYTLGLGGTLRSQYVTRDSSGNFYVLVYASTASNGTIKKYDSNFSYITEWAISSPDGPSQIYGYNDIIWLICYNADVKGFDTSGNVVYTFGARGYVITADSTGVLIAQTGLGASHTYRYNNFGTLLATYDFIGTSMCIDSLENIYVTASDTIFKYDSSGNLITSWGSNGSGDGQFNFGGFGGITFDKFNNVYVSDYWNSRVQKFSPTGVFMGKCVQTYLPLGIICDRSNSQYCYVATPNLSTTGRITKLTIK
jgi:tripartite motif-containing protein 71